MQRSSGPASSISASAAGHSERVSDSISAPSSNSPRASMIAVPWSPTVPDTSTGRPAAAPTATARRAGRACRRRSCTGTSRRQWPRSTTLVSPATISTPGLLGGGGDRLDLGAQVVRGQPLLEDQRQAERQRARAGHGQVVHRAVHRQVADRAAGEADRLHHEAVGGHRHALAHRARVGHGRRASSEPKAGTNSPSISDWVALPPAPWDIVTWLVAELRRLPRAVSMMPRTFSSRAAVAAARSHDLPLAREAAVVVVRGAGALATTPCRCRSGAPACRRCRTPCTRTA